MTDLSKIIFAADDIDSELVPVPQWGVTVQVKSMTARDRARMIGNGQDENGKFNLEEVLPDLVIHSTFDPETGERVFQDSDRDLLLAKSAAAIELIATTAMKLSGMGEDSVGDAGKDSSSTQNEDSSSS